jgi:hypothetical protein
MSAGADRWIRRTTTGCVGLVALIAGTVSVSATLLADSRAGDHGGLLPWALLVVGSAASLAANVAVAQPTPAGRVIAAWPSSRSSAPTSCSCARSAVAQLAVAGRSPRRYLEERMVLPECRGGLPPAQVRKTADRQRWYGPGYSAAGVAMGPGPPGRGWLTSKRA